jgi:hypothetical protein
MAAIVPARRISAKADKRRRRDGLRNFISSRNRIESHAVINKQKVNKYSACRHVHFYCRISGAR